MISAELGGIFQAGRKRPGILGSLQFGRTELGVVECNQLDGDTRSPARAVGERQTNHCAAPDSWLFADGLLCGARCNGGAPGQAPGERQTNKTRAVGFTADEAQSDQRKECPLDGFVLHWWSPGASAGGATNQ
jgi:hypothetical protein